MPWGCAQETEGNRPASSPNLQFSQPVGLLRQGWQQLLWQREKGRRDLCWGVRVAGCSRVPLPIPC